MKTIRTIIQRLMTALSNHQSSIINHPSSIITLFLLLFLFSSCENKRDDNGELGGMWQLTLWRNAQGDTLATNHTGIYYHFQLRLMRIQSNREYLARFRHEGQELLIGPVYLRPDEEELPLSECYNVGIPSDGRFRIDALTNKRMQLSSELGTMQFRKY